FDLYSKKKYYFCNFIQCLRTNPDKVNSKFLFYILKFLYFRGSTNNLQNQTTGLRNLKLKEYSKLKIPIPYKDNKPDLETQKRIVEKLELAEKLKENREKADELTREYLNSVFLDMFGDINYNPHNFKIGTIRDLIIKSQYGSGKKADENNGEFPMLRMNNINYDGSWDFTSLKYVDLDKNEQEKYLVYKGELLFNRTNSKELVGKTAVYRKNTPMAYAGYLIKLKTKNKAISEFISAHLNSKYGKKYLLLKCKSIVGMANINAQEIQETPILLPPEFLMEKYEKIVEQVEQLKQNQQKSKKEINNLYNKLMQQAFNGEL
ncbi:restriction endonuclease subunit S, partial [bacterium]|nr:restriction endonuclease subunit S [bacterium]